MEIGCKRSCGEVKGRIFGGEMVDLLSIYVRRWGEGNGSMYVLWFGEGGYFEARRVTAWWVGERVLSFGWSLWEKGAAWMFWICDRCLVRDMCIELELPTSKCSRMVKFCG